MKIEDILNLTEGTLSNSPKIQAIESATVFQSKVEHGDLFFSSNQEEIEQALDNGAYAIVYDNDKIKRNDEEVAWIKVSNIQLAAFKLIRYVIIKKEAQFFLLSEHENSFLKMILTHKTNIQFIANDWRKAFEQILNSDGTLYVGTDKELMQLIKPDIQKLERDVDGYAVFDTLFKTTFKVGGYVYQEKELIPFHLDYLLRVLHFANENALPYDIERLHYTKHFTPIFIDTQLHKTRSNNSDKVAIFTDSIPDIVEAREYIKRSNNWVKGIVLTPPKTKISGIDRPHWFENEDDIREILKNTLFNYAFIYNADKNVLNTIKEDYTLF
ncbi:MAG: hypothetical protein L3J43_05415 [Sulfurovum sp.]|nr:hypothetical protein [Sulfurovum sp.]